MSLGSQFKKRNSLVISVAILKAAKNGTRKSRLLWLISMSHEQLIRYIRFLKTNGLVEEHDACYYTTDKGFKLIEEFDSALLIRSVLTS